LTIIAIVIAFNTRAEHYTKGGKGWMKYSIVVCTGKKYSLTKLKLYLPIYAKEMIQITMYKKILKNKLHKKKQILLTK